MSFNISFTKKILHCTVFIALCLFLIQVHAQQAITTPILSTVLNFRDLAGISVSNGGSGFVNPTSNNGMMRTGVFYRSNALGSLSNADLATVSSLGIGSDIDLRTQTEIAKLPDQVPSGATYININILGVSANSNTTTISGMQTMYQGFVTTKINREGFRNVLLTLAADTKPDLFHCSAGKDRTGWTSALLQSIAGVAPETIMNNYLATNNYTAAFIQSAWEVIHARDPSADETVTKALLGVQSSYLQAALDQVITTYGSMNAYLKQGLGLSQEDIYVLRAKMVYYQTLPGQNELAGNGANGAALLNALQNSPLSGRYTNYNYYLQSAIDAGTLSGVETQIGGQVHADAASYLLRQGQWINEAIMTYMSSSGLRVGQSQVWLAGLGGDFTTKSYTGVAKSSEYSAGSIIGVTHRLNEQVGINGGLGYDWGSVRSASATVNSRTLLAILGGRYGFKTLDTGTYIEGRADIGWVDYKSERSLNENLGSAFGNTSGTVYSGLAGLGHVMHLTPVTIAPQVGIRVAGVSLGGFNESGSDLALNIKNVSSMYSSALLGMDISLDSKQLCAWTIKPAFTLGYEHLLGNPQIESAGTLYGFTINQNSAYNSRNLIKTGLGIMLQYNAFTVKAKGNVMIGDTAKSIGLNGLLALGYSL